MEHAVPYRRGHAARGHHTLPGLFGAVELNVLTLETNDVPRLVDDLSRLAPSPATPR